MTSFSLKLIAIAAMTANHAAYVFAPALLAQGTPGAVLHAALFSIGGATFPIMAFLVVEGYRHTSDVKRYLQRLLAFAVLSQLPWTLVFTLQCGLGANLNVLFTLAIGLALLWANGHLRNRALYALLVCGGFALSLPCDWGGIGVVAILAFDALRDRGRKGVWLALAVPCAAIALPAALLLGSASPDAAESLLYAIVGFAVAGGVLCRYDGRRGRPMKWFFYAYYPAHIAVLGLMRLFLFG